MITATSDGSYKKSVQCAVSVCKPTVDTLVDILRCTDTSNIESRALITPRAELILPRGNGKILPNARVLAVVTIFKLAKIQKCAYKIIIIPKRPATYQQSLKKQDSGKTKRAVGHLIPK